MKKKRTFFDLSLLIVIMIFTSCNDDDIQVSSNQNLDMYGLKYDISTAALWELEPNRIIETVAYNYVDEYTNEGKQVKDTIKGFKVGEKQSQTGNFILSLYGNGLTLDTKNQRLLGSGACVSMNMASENVKELNEGKYTFGVDDTPFTFNAYVSSNYKTKENVNPGRITEGDVVFSKNGDEYSIDIKCNTSTGGKVLGNYKGKLTKLKVERVKVAKYVDVRLGGLLKLSKREEIWNGRDYGGIYLDLSGTSFLVTSTGDVRNAGAKGKSSIDVTLLYDEVNKMFVFESPLKVRGFLDHSIPMFVHQKNEFNFPCHTIYMKAPSTFTDKDYDDIDKKGFEFEVREEKVTISSENIKPSYIFFMDGKGRKGVIKVKSFIPGYIKETVLYGGFFIGRYPVGPMLVLDIKSPASYMNPIIK